MKRTVLILIIAGMVLLSTGIWLFGFSGVSGISATDLLQFAVILLVVVFAVFVAAKRMQSSRRGEPAEDELSRKTLRRTAAISYYISLYLWVIILFIKDRITMDTEELLGMGILGMALCFALTWVVLYFRGIRNE